MVALSYRLEVVTLPVADVDRSVAFYADGLGFALDVDYEPTPGFRVVQLTPPGYYDIGEQRGAAWSYRDAWPEADGVSDLVSFEADKVEVYLDGRRVHLEPGQGVVPHSVERGLDPDEILTRGG